MKKLTLRVHTYPLAQLLNNMLVLELRRKMKMLRLDSLFRLFANCKEKMTRKLQKKTFLLIFCAPLLFLHMVFALRFPTKQSKTDYMCLYFL